MHKTLIDTKLNFLGIAKRAGKIALGDYAVRAAARSGQAKLIIAASDASAGTKKRARSYAGQSNARYIESVWTKPELGRQFGINSVAMLALTDTGMAQSYAERIEENE